MSSAEESEPEDVIAVSQLESAKTDSPLKSITQDRKKKPDDEGQGKRWVLDCFHSSKLQSKELNTEN